MAGRAQNGKPSLYLFSDFFFITVASSRCNEKYITRTSTSRGLTSLVWKKGRGALDRVDIYFSPRASMEGPVLYHCFRRLVACETRGPWEIFSDENKIFLCTNPHSHQFATFISSSNSFL